MMAAPKNVRFAIAPEILVRAEVLDDLSTERSETKAPKDDPPDVLSFGTTELYSLCESPASFWNQSPCPVACFHDGETFEGKPISLPLSYDAKTKIFGVFGIFCSPGCMKRYASDRRGLPLPRNKILGLMKLMLVTVYKIRDKIIANPPRESLRKYDLKRGYTLDEFRAQGTRGIYVDLVPQCFVFTPVAVCTQKVLTHAEMQERLAQVDVLDKLKSRRMVHAPKGTNVSDLTSFFPVAKKTSKKGGILKQEDSTPI